MLEKKNVEIISAIDAKPVINKKANENFLGALAPLGQIAQTISDILNYKLEVKRLEMECKRIEEVAIIKHHQIDAEFDVEIIRLNQRMEMIKGFLINAAKKIDNAHFSRMAIVRTIDNLNSLLSDHNLNGDEWTKVFEAIQVTTKQLIEFEKEDSKPFRDLVETTQKALESVPLTCQLLEGGE